jgi:hypothetical protein
MMASTQNEVRALIYEMLSAWTDFELTDQDKDVRISSCMVRIRYALDTEMIKNRGD